MATFLGEIRLMGYGTVPEGWHLCDGTALPIAGNRDLHGLLGVQFGGDGTTSFNLPDLRGRVPVAATSPGQALGAETVTLLNPQLPYHTHPIVTQSSLANDPLASGHMLAMAKPATGSAGTTRKIYGEGPPDIALNAATLSAQADSGAAHPNMQPFAVVNFIICLNGEIPSRN